jgi:aromatic ring-opening dioxygenase catalytic subunit (LigB family)
MSEIFIATPPKLVTVQLKRSTNAAWQHDMGKALETAQKSGVVAVKNISTIVIIG